MPKKWMAYITVLLLSLFAVLPAWAQDDIEDPPQLQTDATDPNAEESGESLDGPTAKNGFYCRTPEAFHPVVLAIATRYGVLYEEVLGLFCGTGAPEGDQQEPGQHYGLGVIMLAYETSLELQNGSSSPDEVVPSATELLACKSELGGWGQVWKSLGYKGRSGKGTGIPDGSCGFTVPTPEHQSDSSAEPDHPGNAGGNGKGNGKGKPDKPGKSNAPGKPAHAGPNK